MKVIIAGSRTIGDHYFVEKTIKDSGFEITEIACGCANGVDTIGEVYGIINNILVTKFPADWNKFGKSAGPIRNEQMAKYADALILVWDGKSKGSANMLYNAKKYKLNIFERIIK